ncbi:MULTISPECIES: Cof-type HAD-IIB family hydrolase [unclassified Faecalibacterium]|uniref:Cof-type HAD-IIB family hydrolase n=1 Tax=unclassified Faecalibacterium TaxID=2646395 RepID=UPI000B3707D3|nr:MULTISPECIES: Cof-type HAD-IIB family hydrolase [unclassified Faecalibacterium]OUN74116.1 hydrolase [Faecalibacterium sp. An58]OUQ40648.1 hydrolase [Faecalibacterium sp. An121]
MAKPNIKVLALDLDGTLTNDDKQITPRTRAALDQALAKGVMVVLASGRPTEGVTPVARDLALGQNGRAGAILSYNGGAIVDCGPGARILWQQVLPAPMVPALCSFAAQQNVAIVTYSPEGIVTERPQDPWAMREGFTNKLPMVGVPDLPAYVNYPVNKMLITLDPIRLRPVLQAGLDRFAGQIDLYPSSPFFIEAVPLGVAKDRSLAALLDRMGLTRDNLMACGDGMNDRSMIHYAGVGVAMANAEGPVKAQADYITAADNNHDGVAEAIERFIL